MLAPSFTCLRWSLLPRVITYFAYASRSQLTLFTQGHDWQVRPGMAILSKPAREFVQTQRRPLVLAALIVVLLRSRLGTIGKEGLDAVKGQVVGKGKGRAVGKMDKEESLRVLQKIYEEDPKDEETKVLLVPYRDRVTKVCLFVRISEQMLKGLRRSRYVLRHRPNWIRTKRTFPSSHLQLRTSRISTCRSSGSSGRSF